MLPYYPDSASVFMTKKLPGAGGHAQASFSHGPGCKKGAKGTTTQRQSPILPIPGDLAREAGFSWDTPRRTQDITARKAAGPSKLAATSASIEMQVTMGFGKI